MHDKHRNPGAGYGDENWQWQDRGGRKRKYARSSRKGGTAMHGYVCL